MARPTVLIDCINRSMTSSRFTAWLPRTLVSGPLCTFVVCECRSSDASEFKEEVTAGKRKFKVCWPRRQGNCADSSLFQIIAMHEDIL